MNKKKIHINVFWLLFLIAAATSCAKPNKTFTITGTINGVEDGKRISLVSSELDKLKSDTTIIKNGVFKFTGSVDEPTTCFLSIEDNPGSMPFYVENSKIYINGNSDSLDILTVTGSRTQDDSKLLNSRLKIPFDRYKHKTDSLYKIAFLDLYNNGDQEFRAFYEKNKDNMSGIYYYLYKKSIEIPENQKRKLDSEFEYYQQELEQVNIDFIKEFPKSFISAILVSRICRGEKQADIESFINMLDPSMKNYPTISKIVQQLEEMKKTEVSVESFIPNAHNLAYSVEKTYKGSDHKNVIYLAVLSNDNICALKSDSSVLVIDAKGTKVNEFNTKMTTKTSAVAVDKSDNIYVFGTLMGKKKLESRGTTRETDVPVGVECVVFNPKGEKIRELKLADVISATGARVADGTIVVADARGRKIATYNAETGEKTATIEKVRSCCGILDFSIRNNEILVANLGAFRVNGFDYTGKPTISFGQRGNGIDDFHGCCNPVSVAFLSNGGIVTVEKDPTRIKVYSKEGAKKVEGIEELVKGCAYIPMVVDSKDNVYLASKTGGVIKCIPAK